MVSLIKPILSSAFSKDGNGSREHCQRTASAGPRSASHNVLANVIYPIILRQVTCWWGGVGEQCGGEGEVEAGEDPVLPRAPRDPAAWWCSPEPAPPPRKWSPLPGLLRYGSAW